MWSVTIQSKSVNSQGNYTFVVVYSNGSQTVTETYDISTPDGLNVIVTRRLADLNKIDPTVTSIPTGPFTPIAPAVDINKAAYQTALDLLARYQRVINFGILTMSDPGYVAALADAQKKFNVSYL